MTIDKKIKYAIQGGGPNYLGKQKMVKAPKKWLSSPDHEPAELAYITKKEKDILLDLNIYGSLKNGKPNRGPSGIMSLQGDMGGYGGTGGGGGQGGGGGGNPNQDRAREEAIRAANKAAQDRAAASMREQAAQRDREEAAAEKQQAERETISKNPIGGLDQFAKEVGLLEDKYTSGTKLGLGDLPGTLQDYYKNKLGVAPRSQFQVYKPPVPAGTGEGLGSIDVGFQNALRKQQIRKDDIAAQQDPNYGQFFRPQPVVEKPKFFDTGMGKFVKGAGTAMALPMASAFLPKQAVTALTWGKRIKDIKDRKGIYGKALGFMEDKTGKKLGFNNLTSTMDKAKAAKFRDERTTLGKQDIEDWERKQDWSGIKPDVGGGGDGQGQGQGQGQAQAQAPKDVVTASIQKFTPEQADMMKQRHSQLQGVLESGVYQGRQLTAEEIQMLQQKSLEIQKLMEQYLVDPEELGLARGGIARLYG